MYKRQHQDGLVHLSQLADRFVKDAHEVVKAGDVVKVRVVDIDVKRNRISLTMRKDGGAPAPREQRADSTGFKPKPAAQGKPQPSTTQGAFGAALADALRKK